MPDWLAWLLPVPLATLGAVAWAAWRARPRGPADSAEIARSYERMRRALEPAQRPAPRRVPNAPAARAPTAPAQRRPPRSDGAAGPPA